MTKQNEAVVFFIPTSSIQRATKLLEDAAKRRAEPPKNHSGSFESAFEQWLSFDLLMNNPFVLKGKGSADLMGYTKPGSALHVANLHGWPRQDLALIKVELSQSEFERLHAANRINNVTPCDEAIWNFDAFALFALSEPNVRFSVLSQDDKSLQPAATEAGRKREEE